MSKDLLKLLSEVKKELKSQKKDLRIKEKELERDEVMQDDSEWVRYYNNNEGWVQALELVVDIIKEKLNEKV